MFPDTEFQKSRLFGIDFDVVTMRDAVDWILQAAARGTAETTQYVVTPNINLTMLHQDSSEFRKVVHHSAMTIVDGMPIVKASKYLCEVPLPERVAGSDLVYTLFDAAIPEFPLRVFLLGGAAGVPERARQVVESRWPGVTVVGLSSPPPGFESDAEKNARVLDEIRDADANVLILGLGSPKQELWGFRNRHQISASVTLCVGATIDFLAGEQRRAPEWFRASGLEWAWRVMTNPRRLLGRYSRDAIRIPKLLLDQISDLCPIYQASNFTSVDSQSRSVSSPD